MTGISSRWCWRGTIGVTIASIVLPVTVRAESPNTFTHTPVSAHRNVTLTTLMQRLVDDVVRNRRSQGDVPVSITLTDIPLASAILTLSRQTGVRIASDAGIVPKERRVTISVVNVSLREALAQLLLGTGLTSEFQPNGNVVIRKLSVQADTTASVARIIGMVVDSAAGRPVRGAMVTVSGTSATAVTKQDGSYVLENVPLGKREVSVRAMGYAVATRSVTVSKDGFIRTDFVLRMIASQLSDVVTTVSGLQRRATVPNDIVKIDPQKMMERAPVRSVADLISAAQVPGVIVQRQSGEPGAPVRFRMRGISSIAQSNDPVIILDGVWIDATVERPSRIDDLDPAMIESIEIIRGPSAGALYGQNAANGVILIKTRKGQAGPTRWSVDMSRDWGSTYGKYPAVYAGLGRGISVNGYARCSNDLVLNGNCVQDSVAVFDPNHSLNRTHTSGALNRIVLRAEGGSPVVNYSLSVQASDQLGTRRSSEISQILYRRLGFTTDPQFLKPSFLARRGAAMTYTIQPTSRTTITLGMNGAISEDRNNLYSNAFGQRTITEYDSLSLDTTGIENRVSRIRALEDRTNVTNMLLSSNIQHRITNTWNTALNLGLERSSRAGRRSDQSTICTFGNSCRDTLMNRDDQNIDRRILSLRSNVSGVLPKLAWGAVELRPAIGLDFQRTDNRYIRLSQEGIPPGSLGVQGTGAGVVRGETATTANATAGWFLNTNVGLLNRIYFDLGIRQDLGSALANSSRYPKLGTAWLVSEESFWRKNDIVSLFRLRGNVGYSAVQPEVSDIAGLYESSYAFLNGVYVPIVKIRSVGNRGLVPERAMEFEGGIDLGFFQDRFEVIATFAHKDGRNTLVPRLTAPSVVEGNRKENIARVLNRNLELTTNARIIERTNLGLIVDYSLTLSDNEVGEIGSRVSPLTHLDGIRAGYPLGGVWTKMLLGYDDADNDGIIAPSEVIVSDSAVYVGWGLPRYSASYGVNLRVSKITFDTRFSYRSQYVVDFSGYRGLGLEDRNAPLDVQAIARVQGLGGQKPVSDLRWNSASVTMHVPVHLVQRLRMRSASVSLQGSNLYTWTNYIGRDPSVSAGFSSEVTADNGWVTPTPRRFVLDFKLGI